jgi:hypothetical protein
LQHLYKVASGRTTTPAPGRKPKGFLLRKHDKPTYTIAKHTE